MKLRIAVVFIICLINVGLSVWIAILSGTNGGTASAAIYSGTCKTANSLSTWVHLAINILSTGLLGASNFFMQYLVAPTRADVDNAHKSHMWLDIGVPSIHNLRHIPLKRVILWSILALTSLPVHVLYNATLFSTVIAPDYELVLASEAFLSNPVIPSNISFGYEPFGDISTWKKLDNAECLDVYTPNLAVVGHRNLLLVFEANRPDNLTVYSPGVTIPGTFTTWMCSDTQSSFTDGSGCDLSKIDPNTWTVKHERIQFCLSEPFPEECRLEFSLILIVVVALANVAKVTAMLLSIRSFRSAPLATLGDAIASFQIQRRTACALSVARTLPKRVSGPPNTNLGSCIRGVVSGGLELRPPGWWCPTSQVSFDSALLPACSTCAWGRTTAERI